MTILAKSNKGYSYVLVVIDTFSKYAWLRPIKKKQGQSVAAAFKDILKAVGGQIACGLIKVRNSERGALNYLFFKNDLNVFVVKRKIIRHL